jgi:hypothetical protein
VPSPGGELGQAAPVRVHHVDMGMAVTVAGEGDPDPVRRPVRVTVLGAVRDQLLRTAAIGVGEVDLVAAVPVGGERDLGSVRREPANGGLAR